MQLDDILEENSLKTISQKTKISEDYLENLLNKNFAVIKKIKALGFISILEREYNVDLTTLKEEAREYYGDMREDQSLTLSLPITEEKKEKSKLFIFVVLALLGYASWYFFTQFDKKTLSKMIPFIGESTLEDFVPDLKVQSTDIDNLSISKVNIDSEPLNKESDINTKPAKETIVEANTQNTTTTQATEDINPVVTTKKTVSIVPVHRLWFGMVNMDTKQRENFFVSEAYELDVSAHGWLVATSKAAFSVQDGVEIKEFNDAQEHYFKIDNHGVENLSKNDYVALGGWLQW